MTPTERTPPPGLHPLIDALDQRVNRWPDAFHASQATFGTWRFGPTAVVLTTSPLVTLSLVLADVRLVRGRRGSPERAARWSAVQRLLAAPGMPLEMPVFDEDRRLGGVPLRELPSTGALVIQWVLVVDADDPAALSELTTPFTWCQWTAEELLRSEAGRSTMPDLSTMADIAPPEDDPRAEAEISLLSSLAAGNHGMSALMDWPLFFNHARHWRRDKAIGLSGIAAAADLARAEEEKSWNEAYKISKH